jgi:nitrate/TMAO reductase-like tetraheme cytochrome c subunit
MGPRRRLVAFLLLTRALIAQDHVNKPTPEYVSGDECLFCHRVKPADTWQQNPHARTVFPNEKNEYFLGAKLARPLRKEGYGKFALQSLDKSKWEPDKFADRCAGCHTTAVDPKTKTFAASALDCYTCHGVVDLNHTKDTALVRFSRKYPKDAKEVTSTCAQCHLRGGRSASSGLPYPNNFVPGDDLFHDYQVDLKLADDTTLNPGDRHIYQNVRDILQNNGTVTCINCHQIHGDSSRKHRLVLSGPICLECHNAEGPKKNVKTYTVHSAVCEY